MLLNKRLGTQGETGMTEDKWGTTRGSLGPISSTIEEQGVSLCQGHGFFLAEMAYLLGNHGTLSQFL